MAILLKIASSKFCLVQYGNNRPTCVLEPYPHLKRVPLINSDDTIDQERLSTECAPRCYDCSHAGPGKCDVGRCFERYALDEGSRTCKRKDHGFCTKFQYIFSFKYVYKYLSFQVFMHNRSYRIIIIVIKSRYVHT